MLCYYLQPLSDILLDDSRALLEGSQVHDELVRAQTVSSSVEHVVVAAHLGRHVVRVQDGQLIILLQRKKGGRSFRNGVMEKSRRDEDHRERRVRDHQRLG